jgi:hypothetical protein
MRLSTLRALKEPVMQKFYSTLVSRPPQATDDLHPAKYLFHFFPAPLTDRVAGMPRRSLIDRRIVFIHRASVYSPGAAIERLAADGALFDPQ